MKTERRHELQTNWLADQVGEFIKAVQPYSKALIGLLLAALVLWGVLLIMSRRAEAEEANGWTKLWNGLLGGLGAREDLESLAEASAKRPPDEWAQLLIADADLNSGVTYWFTEKAVGRNNLNAALDMYQSVFKNSTNPLLREHALYGVGRAEESLCKLEEARNAYEQLRRDFPNGSYAARAKQRLESLKRESTEARYDWFARLEPPAHAFSKEGEAGTSLPPELQPPSQFTAPKSKTPPPAPTPDLGPTVPTEPKPPAGKAPGTSAPAKANPSSAVPAQKPAGKGTAGAPPASSTKAATKNPAPASGSGKP